MLSLSLILIKFFSVYFNAYYCLTNSSIDVLLDLSYAVYLFSHSLMSIVLVLNKLGNTNFNSSIK